MDFFEAQARAKKRTSRLVVLFSLAVLGTIAAGYFGAIFLTGQLTQKSARTRDRYGYVQPARAPAPGEGHIHLAFRGAAWVEITDARGKVVVFDVDADGN